MLFFFFSSRRRHTRWTGDWSSDVCSSDLKAATAPTLRLSWAAQQHDVDDAVAAFRSEERRVGKECRSRGSPDHSKKKRNIYSNGSPSANNITIHRNKHPPAPTD